MCDEVVVENGFCVGKNAISVKMKYFVEPNQFLKNDF